MTPQTAMDMLFTCLRDGVDPSPKILRALVHTTDQELIEAWWKDGATDQELADLFATLGRVGGRGAPLTRTAIRKRRYNLGLKQQPPPRVDREKLRALWEMGANAQEISILLGCSWRTAQQLLFEEGLKTESGRRSILSPD